MKKLTWLHVFALVTFPFFLWAQTHSKINENAEKFKEIATNANTPAIQLAHWDGKKIEKYAVGYKDIVKQDTIDNETIFQAASLSKVVATYAFLVLVDKGLLDLDKPLWSYYEYDRLKNDPNKELMTARHVLMHQTGLVNWEKPKGSELKTRFKPGTSYRYSGEGFVYLQLVAEKITGKSLDQICEEYIFKPFGMEKSHYVYTPEIGKNIAVGHSEAKNTKQLIVNKTRQKFTQAGAAHTLYTTADEYMKFVIEGVYNGKGLSKKMHKDFLTANRSIFPENHKLGGYNKKRVCLGIMQQVNEEGISYYHTGSNGGGFRCMFVIYPQKQQAIAFFTNSNSGGATFKPVLEQMFGTNQTYWITVR